MIMGMAPYCLRTHALLFLTLLWNNGRVRMRAHAGGNFYLLGIYGSPGGTACSIHYVGPKKFHFFAVFSRWGKLRFSASF